MKNLLCLLTLLLATACASTHTAESPLKQVAEDYFSVYAKRENFEQLMSFYADGANMNRDLNSKD